MIAVRFTHIVKPGCGGAVVALLKEHRDDPHLHRQSGPEPCRHL